MMIRGLVMAYGDIRVERRSEEIVEAITSKGTVVVRELGETRAGEKRIRNFLDSPHVDVDAISEDFAARTVAQCRNRDVLIIQDTTEINFDKRDKKRSGFGPGADGETPAYFIHAAIVVDRATEAVLGRAPRRDLDALRTSCSASPQARPRGKGIRALAPRL